MSFEGAWRVVWTVERRRKCRQSVVDRWSWLCPAMIVSGDDRGNEVQVQGGLWYFEDEGKKRDWMALIYLTERSADHRSTVLQGPGK
jgi:hypothetical protein